MKLVLNNIESGFASNSALNANFDLVETAIENTLSRDGTSPNDMLANLDMNGYLIINQGNPIAISGMTWEGPWVTTQPYSIGDIIESNGTAYIAVVVHTSDVFADDLTAGYWQVFATASLPSQTGNAGKLLQTDGASASWQVPDATEVSFTQTGTGAVATLVSEKGIQSRNVMDFLTAAQQTDVRANTFGVDVTVAFQAAIDSLATLGGVLEVDAGTYRISAALVLPSKVYLKGKGSSNTRIKLANSSNCPILKTLGFDTLTLQNKWLISENVPYGFGFDGITFDGNRANQTSGNGISIYGKGYNIGFDVKVVEAKEIGFYSECAFKGGQVVEQDMPEGHIGKVQVYKSGKEGFVYRGPHDQVIHDVFISQAGQDGVYDGVSFEAQTNIYQGATYVTGQIHSYACTGRGISVKSFLPGANILTGENCDRDGVVFEAAGETVGMLGSLFSNVDFVEAYGNDNNNTGLYWGIRCSGSSNQLTSLRVSSAGQAAGGVYLSGNLNTVGGGTVTGVNAVADGIGVKVDGSYHNLKLIVENFNSGAAVGFNSAGTSYCNLSVTMFGCSVTGWLNSGASTYDHFDISSFAAGGTAFTQSGSFGAQDIFSVTTNHGTAKLSRYSGTNSAIVAGTTSTTLTHTGFVTPKASNIRVTQQEDWGANRMWVANITATTFDVVTDAAPAANLDFSWELDI
jgi:hypothetical protein